MKIFLPPIFFPLLIFFCHGCLAENYLYRSSFADAKSVAGWRMEGPGKIEFHDGWMTMYSPDQAMHHVLWCPENFPASFRASWQVQNLNTDAGLLIVFFAAQGLQGEDILSTSLPKRDGTFDQYTQGKIRNYHISYYANAAHNPDRPHANLRKNNGFSLVQEGKQGIPANSTKIHTITLEKNNNRIRMWIDEREIINWSDDGKRFGPVWGEGKIGFRQMKWSRFRYRDFRVWSLEKPDS